MALPDRFIDHNTQDKQYEEAALNARGIVATVLAALGQEGRVLGVPGSSRNPPLVRTS